MTIKQGKIGCLKAIVQWKVTMEVLFPRDIRNNIYLVNIF